MNPILACLLAFATSIGVDFVYSMWIIGVTKGYRTSASGYSAVLTLLGGLSTFLFFDHWYTLLPAAFGHAAGTWIAMRHTHGK